MSLWRQALRMCIRQMAAGNQTCHDEMLASRDYVTTSARSASLSFLCRPHAKCKMLRPVGSLCDLPPSSCRSHSALIERPIMRTTSEINIFCPIISSRMPFRLSIAEMMAAVKTYRMTKAWRGCAYYFDYRRRFIHAIMRQHDALC